ncbi:uncharacterized protein L203_106119 [Cryptococcus depauperatus CBS 7841]|uniref:Uncharacterized protein n=1 Tax=Cryptococcus depauperatus CBS 7841 TaxID=1295531 RepID=A0A1E3IVC9_9TREE|nr:hypothetical protein L203_00826 [Cryptococcus depauperatus CBS 7841]
MGKLKVALASHQHSAAKTAAKKRAQAAQDVKQTSVKASLDGVKKGKKRARQASIRAKNGRTNDELGKSNNTIKNKPPTIPFDKQDTILLLGEANFSFSLSLLSSPHNHPPHLIFATAFDTEEITRSKYPDAEGHVKELRDKGVMVEFGVDAGALERCKALAKGRRWSKVIFNFPHVGAGITDQDRNILTNQHMLLRFFRSVEPFLTTGPSHISLPKIVSKREKKGKQKLKKTQSSDNEDALSGVSDSEHESETQDYPAIEDEPSSISASSFKQRDFEPPHRAGTILITLLTCPPYTLWCLPQLAARPPPTCPGTNLPQPRYTLLRSFEFMPQAYKGYAHRRTIGWKEGLSKSENEEILGRRGIPRTYEFIKALGNN